MFPSLAPREPDKIYLFFSSFHLEFFSFSYSATNRKSYTLTTWNRLTNFTQHSTDLKITRGGVISFLLQLMVPSLTLRKLEKKSVSYSSLTIPFS